MESNKNKDYILYLDLLNIAACIAVVILHINNAVHTFSYKRYWLTSMVLEAGFYWAVPIFLMLTGATLLDYRKRYDTQTFLKRRLSKVVPPYIIWSLVAIVWRIVYLHRGTFQDVNSLGKIIDNIANNKSMSIYWFFPVIISIYFCIPVLTAIPEEMRLGKKGIYTYMILCALVTVSTLPLVAQLLGIQWNSGFQITVAGGYLIFPLLGYSLAHTELSKVQRKIVYLLGIFGWIMYYVGTVVLSYQQGKFSSVFKGYIRLPGVLMGIAVFVFFQYHCWDFIKRNQVFVRIIKIVSGASFGVYLIHHFFLEFFVQYFAINIQLWQWRVFGVFLIYPVSLITVLLIKKIPLLKKIVP